MAEESHRPNQTPWFVQTGPEQEEERDLCLDPAAVPPASSTEPLPTLVLPGDSEPEPVPPATAATLPLPTQPVLGLAPPPPGSPPALVELMRLGGPSALDPRNLVAGVLIVTRTPQAARRGQVIPLKAARTVVGSGSRIGCTLDDAAVSEFHAVIVFGPWEGGTGFRWHPVAGSAAWINGALVDAPRTLASGDAIRLGSTELAFFEAGLR